MASEDLPADGHGGPADLQIRQAKAVLRRRLRTARAVYVAGLDPPERLRQETALVARLIEHLPPGLIAGYHAVGSEISPSHDLIALFPRVVAGAPLTFHHGLPDAPPGVPDVVLVPLLAVDRHGTRLGQGGGHYDRTLADLRARRPVLAVGVGWDIQLVDDLPAEPWDAPLDALATPSRWLTFGPQPLMSRR